MKKAEDDLYSDALESATNTFLSVRHGIVRNAERASETPDGEKVFRRALAAAIDRYNECSGLPHDLPKG